MADGIYYVSVYDRKAVQHVLEESRARKRHKEVRREVE